MLLWRAARLGHAVGGLLSVYGLLVMVGLGFPWLLVPAVVWMLGHGVLMGLTLFDAHWDEMALAQLTRRYRAAYDAG